jgi:hypothetical protein
VSGELEELSWQYTGRRTINDKVVNAFLTQDGKACLFDRTKASPFRVVGGTYKVRASPDGARLSVSFGEYVGRSVPAEQLAEWLALDEACGLADERRKKVERDKRDQKGAWGDMTLSSLREVMGKCRTTPERTALVARVVDFMYQRGGE